MTQVSILIPTYNSGSFLEAALDHLASQLAPGDEVIIQDNLSSDGTPGVVERFDELVSSTVIYRRERDRGQSDALSRGLAIAKRPWVVWLNADDRLDRLDLLRDMAAPEVDVVAGGYQIEDESGRVLRTFPGRVLQLDRLLLRGCYLFSGALMFRTSALKAVGGFDPRWQYCMDYDLFLRLAASGVPTVACNDVTATFRIQPQSKTSNAQRKFVQETHELRVRSGRGVVPLRHLYAASATHAVAALLADVRYTRAYSQARTWLRRQGSA